MKIVNYKPQYRDMFKLLQTQKKRVGPSLIDSIQCMSLITSLRHLYSCRKFSI